jgi:hypothetical protein
VRMPAEGVFTVSGNMNFFPNLEEALKAARTIIGPVKIFHCWEEHLSAQLYAQHVKTVAELAGRSP